MQWEHDEEEDEIQVYKTSRIPEEKRHYHGRSSSFTQHRPKELPVFEDSFAKRLGQRSKSNIRERNLERTNASLTTTIPRTSRSNDVVQVDKNCCRWPCVSDGPSGVPHSDSQKALSTSGYPPTRSFNSKEPRSLCALLTRKLFRQKNNHSLPYRAWEDEWALFREQHESEMKQMKQMYTSLQEICQELKRMGSHRGDASGVSSRHQSVSEGIDNRADRAPVLGLSKRHGTLNYASYLRENGPHQPNRRAKSAPKTRVNRDAGFTKENSVFVQDPYGSSRYSPNEVLFEETVQMERIYLRKFVAALIKYDDDRYDSELEQDGRSLRDVVERLLPHANFAKDWHFKYGIEAWVSRIAFREFGKSEEKGPGARARRIASWEEYQKLAFLSPVEAIMPEGEDYVRSFHLFCNDKFGFIGNELKWKEEWPDHLVKDFLEAMKHVWRAHKLALAFEPVVSQFSMKPSAQFDVKFMEPLELPTVLQTDTLSPFTPQVGFLVNPGFIVLDRIIKCQVYLAPDVSVVSS
ncbi:hypothetical protein M758_3G082900 [Ceratodon purpureus]|nr:hypothetical protein M758_3G082900 [Ceratodon purpureus]